MRRKFLFGFVFAVLLLSLASAGSTLIKVNTLADHEINLQFLNPDNDGVVSFGTPVTLDTGAEGYVEYSFEHTSDLFDLNVFLMKDGKKVLNKKFTEISNDGNEICLLIVSNDILEIEDPCVKEVVEEEVYEEISEKVEQENTTLFEIDNQTTNMTDEIVSENETKSKFNFRNFLSILGFATSDGTEESSSWNFLYYVFGLIALLVVIFFVVRWMRKRKNSPKVENKTPQPPTQQISQEEKPQHSIEDVEKRIFEAQEELKELKKIEEIRRAKKKLAEDQERLRRLQEMERQGENYNNSN